MFWFFGPEAHGILTPRTGKEPGPLALEVKALTTGQPEKSHFLGFSTEVKSYGECMSFLNCFLVNPFLDYVSEKLIKAMYSLCQSTIYSYNSFQPLLGAHRQHALPPLPCGPQLRRLSCWAATSLQFTFST